LGKKGAGTLYRHVPSEKSPGEIIIIINDDIDYDFI